MLRGRGGGGGGMVEGRRGAARISESTTVNKRGEGGGERERG